MNLNKFIIFIPAVLFTLSSCNQPVAVKKPQTYLDTVSYSIGILYGDKLHSDGLDSVNTNLLKKGMDDAINEKPSIDKDKAKQIVMEYYSILSQRQLLTKYGDNKIAGEKFLSENAKRKGVKVLPSGLQYEVLKSGSGLQPDSNDVVIVHYRGELIDGTVFEENFGKKPVPLAVNRVIPGWTEALLRMHVGDTWKIYIPYQLGYGTSFNPNSPIQPYSTLIFEIELVDIKKEP